MRDQTPHELQPEQLRKLEALFDTEILHHSEVPRPIRELVNFDDLMKLVR